MRAVVRVLVRVCACACAVRAVTQVIRVCVGTMADMDEATLDEARMAAVDARDAAVNEALSGRDYAGAVAKAIENPPVGTKTAAIKVCLGCGGLLAVRHVRVCVCVCGCVCVCVRRRALLPAHPSPGTGCI